jgi:hypothetical protein
MPFANMAGITAIVVGVMVGAILLSGRSNWRMGATLILAGIGLYGFAALYAIQAVASVRP